MTKKETVKTVTIKQLNLGITKVKIIGTAPYVQNAAHGVFAAKPPSAGKKKKASEDAEELRQWQYRNALHKAKPGWYGIPCAAFRNAMIDACRLTGEKMTLAKMSVFVLPSVDDGYDEALGMPLVRITKGVPDLFERPVRNAHAGTWTAGISAKWDIGWEATVAIQFDQDQFTLDSIYNLLSRVGQQVGIGMGRPFGREGAGCGWGLFKIVTQGEKP